MKYAFILGRNTALSIAEILAVLPEAKVVKKTSPFLILENIEIEPESLIKRLGGTIKIGEVIGETIDPNLIFENLKDKKQDNKLNFGISYYDRQMDKIGMEVKGRLKKAGISCRLVTSKEKALSSVVVTKNRVHDFLFCGDVLAKTVAVQDFESYGFRDFGRPDRDMESGSLPPKLAQILINLTQTEFDKTLLDPFCGSGTVLQEALVMGYQSVIGTDKSPKAIADSKKNISWLNEKFGVDINGVDIRQVDVRKISGSMHKVDGIATEPYLGPPLKGKINENYVKKNAKELKELYLDAFVQFELILNKDGKVAMVFPSFKIGKYVIDTDISEEIKKLGFTQVNDEKLMYGRPGQKVWRDIKVFKR